MALDTIRQRIDGLQPWANISNLTVTNRLKSRDNLQTFKAQMRPV